jgi:excisionase family DNA binding protein
MSNSDISTLVRPIAYRPAGAARACGLSRSRIYEAISSGKLKAHKLGGATLIFDHDLRAYLNQECTRVVAAVDSGADSDCR